MKDIFHSVTLDKSKCVGCTNCVKRCPTEAIRVRYGKAKIISERCIDCGECIRVCPHFAKKAVYDEFDVLDKYKYKIALPAPALYGQFEDIENINYILYALLSLGFDHVYEVAKGAELVSSFTRNYMNYINSQDDKSGFEKAKKPVISSACPAIVRLIRARFPNLCSHVLPILAPVEIAAKNAKTEAMKKTRLSREDIGVFFISPCPAKVTNAYNPIGTSKQVIDGVLSISSVYKRMAKELHREKITEDISDSGIMGISWATSGGESSALLNDKYLAADGIEHVMKVLEEVEDDKLKNIDFIELNACTGGCVGGCLNIENPFVAKARIQTLRKYLPVSKNKLDSENTDDFYWDTELSYDGTYEISDDMNEAMRKMLEIEKLRKKLPGTDCGTCGAPSCRAFAEDVIMGKAKKSDCIFIYKEKISNIVEQFSNIGINLNNEKEK